MANALTSITPSTPASAAARRGALLCRALAYVVLVAAVADVGASVWHFAMTRFFTIDEYQWGHATWLVSIGKLPYRDFYEHHLPLGYILHSLLLSDGASFTENALLLRKVSFAYLAVASLFVALSSVFERRDRFEALLMLCVPTTLGFGLMSAIDYRGDNWSAFTLLASFSLLAINQVLERRWLAIAAGLVFSASLLMTQKTLLVGGLPVAVMLVAGVARNRAAAPWRLLARLGVRSIAHPVAFGIAALAPIAMFVLVAALLGQLGRVIEITLVQAWRHEQLYPAFSAWRFLDPYLTFAPLTTALLGLGAAYHVARNGLRDFWTLPTLAALCSGLLIKAPYPYNFVLASFLVGICAVRGYADLARRMARRWPRLEPWSPLACTLPLALVPAQLGFVEDVTSNVDQLETLRQIEAYTKPDDVVIDSEGSALFRPHRSYYWYQGRAHVLMFQDYFQNQFLDDLKATRAPFWLNGLRSQQLPARALEYLYKHYIPFRGDLYALGFALRPNTSKEPIEGQLDVVRSGQYHLLLGGTQPSNGSPSAVSSFPAQLGLDGVPVSSSPVSLDAGPHHVSIPPGAPGYRLALLPASAFDAAGWAGRHAPLFEYDRPR